VMKFLPNIRFRLMLLMPQSKAKALAVGVPAQWCFAVNELKSNALAQSCLCPGFATLLLNLTMSDCENRPKVVHEDWQEEYLAGAKKEVYSFCANDIIAGQLFWEANLLCYEKYSVFLIAAQVDGNITINPALHKMSLGDVLYGVSDEATNLDPLRLLGEDGNFEDVQAHYRANRVRRKDFGEKANFEGKFLRDDTRAQPKEARASSERKITTQDKLLLASGTILPQFSAVNAAMAQVTGIEKPRIIDRALFRAAAAFTGEANHKIRNRDHEHRLEEEAVAADQITREGGHIILASSARGEWQSIHAFLTPLRASYLYAVRPVIVLTPDEPPKELWDRFTDVAFVIGHPSRPTDMLRAGCDSADKVVVIAGTPDVEERHLVDSNVVITATSFEAFMSNRKENSPSQDESASKIFAIYELLSMDNCSMLRSEAAEIDVDEYCSPNVIDLRKAAIQRIDESYTMHQSYAAGHVFSPPLLGALLAQAYYTPGIMELMDALVLPNRRHQEVFPWQMPVPAPYVGKPYRELYRALASSGAGVMDSVIESAKDGKPDLVTFLMDRSHALALGMYRTHAEGQSYVSTCPDPTIVLDSKDKIFVLASKEWGNSMTMQCAVAEGHLLHLLGDDGRGNMQGPFPWIPEVAAKFSVDSLSHRASSLAACASSRGDTGASVEMATLADPDTAPTVQAPSRWSCV